MKFAFVDNEKEVLSWIRADSVEDGGSAEYDLPGGKVRVGETLEDAAHRELYEELKEYPSSWFKEFYRLSGVHLHFTTGYKSQSNGLVERCNRKLSQLLRNPSADQTNWLELLRPAVLAMNEMKQERLGVTALEAETGVRPRTVLDFDPNLIQERDGETVVNPEMTEGQHREAVKKTIDRLLCLRHGCSRHERGVDVVRALQRH